MKRTTTSRSRSLAVLVAVLALGAGTAVAQDTLETRQEGQRPRVHVVVEGETLWDLAALYLADPLLWPDIYRLNTLVVEDPHWIFPGEELLLAPADATRVAAEPEGVTVVQPPGEQEPEVEMPPAVATPPPPPPTEDAPTVFMRERMARGGPQIGIRGSAYSYRAVRVGEFYAAGFLTEGDVFPWARVLGAIGRPTLGTLRSTSSAKIYNRIEIDAPAGAEYQIGDSLLVARIGRDVSGGWGRVVVPTGIAVVTHVSGRRVAAELVRQFGRVADGQVAMPLEPFKDPGVVVPVPVENGMEGRVVVPRDRNVVHGQQDIIFIDLGRADGVTVGDVFEVIRPVSTELGESEWEQVAVLHVVHVREQSSSAMLLTINSLGTEPGARVRLIRKMPS